MYSNDRSTTKSKLPTGGRHSSSSNLDNNRRVLSPSGHNSSSRMGGNSRLGHSPEVEVVSIAGTGEIKTKTQMARAYEEEQELRKSAEDRAGLKTIKTSRVLKKTTTITKGENEKQEDERVEKFRLNLEKMNRELDELECRLDQMKPVSNNKKELQAQLAEMNDFMKCLSKAKDHLSNLTDIGDELIRDGVAADPQEIRDGLRECRDKLNRIEDKANKRLRDIKNALDKAEKMKAMEKWRLSLDALKRRLNELENQLNNMAPVAKDKPTLLRQRDEIKDFIKNLDDVSVELRNLKELGDDLIRQGLASDPREIREGIRDCENQLNKLYERAKQRLRDINDALDRADKLKAMEKWRLRLDAIRRRLDELEKQLNNMAPVANDRPTLLRQRQEIIDFIKSLDDVGSDIQALKEMGDDLIRRGLALDPQEIRDGIRSCENHLNKLYERARKRLRDIDDALKKRDQLDELEAAFKKAADEIAKWLDNARNNLIGEENVGADLDTVNVLIEQHKAFKAEFAAKQSSIDEIRRRGNELLAMSPNNVQAIRDIMHSIASKASELDRLVKKISENLDKVHQTAEKLHISTHSLLSGLAEAEQVLKATEKVKETDEAACSSALEQVEKTVRTINTNLAQDKDQVERLARNLLAMAHPDGEPVLKHWLNICQDRWDEIENLSKQRVKRLTEVVRLLRELLSLADKLTAYLSKHEGRLIESMQNQVPEAREKLNALVDENKQFIDELRKQEQDFDRIVRVFSIKSARNDTSKVVTQNISQQSNSKSNEHLRFSQDALKAQTSYAGYGDEYPEVCNDIVKLLIEKWRSVWQLATDKLEKLIRVQESKFSSETIELATSKKPKASGKLPNETIIDEEIQRLGLSKKLYHAGDGLYKFSALPRLRRIKATDRGILVSKGKGWQILSDFARDIQA